MCKRFFLAALLVVSLLLSPVFSVSCRAAMPGSSGVQKGDMAPDFTLKDLNGKPVTLSQLRGKVVVLNFWASWCPHCREEMPSLARLNEVYGSSDFALLAVNVEGNGEGEVKSYLAKHPFNFTVLLDPKLTVQDLYGVYELPETLIINKKGQVVEKVLGSMDWSSVEVLKFFSPLVNE